MRARAVGRRENTLKISARISRVKIKNGAEALIRAEVIPCICCVAGVVWTQKGDAGLFNRITSSILARFVSVALSCK